jgi:signal transduction histidine kinase
MRGFTAFCAANALFICVAPPITFTRFTVASTVVYAAFGLYILVSVIIAVLRKKRPFVLSRAEQWLLLLGVFVYAVFSALGVWAHQWAVVLMGLDYPVVGMMLFLFLNILALAIGFTRTERELDEARKVEREMQETNRTLARLNRVRAIFLTNISHELKTPLAGIINMAGYIKRKLKNVPLDEDTNEILNAISERSEWLSMYVKRLLNQALAQENKLDFEAVDVSRLLRRAAELTEPILRERRNRLSLNIDDNLPPVSGVEDMLLRVLMNLVSNANRHSEGKEIVIKASPAPMTGLAEIRVTDKGSGIPDDILQNIFYRGVSGDGGSGLGLAICKDIVSTHGGEIKISSDLGIGTEVWFTVPLAKE